MKLTYSSSLVLTLTSVISAANLPACSSQPYQAATLLSSYAPAQSFCTKNFPLPRAITTFTAALVTLTSTAAAETQVVTVAVAGSTATDSAVTSVITQTVTSTSIGTVATDILWITETEARRRRKRAATTIVNSALASLWSSISSRGSATLSTLCACIGAPATSTVTFTPKTTVATTPTIYKTTTLLSIVTVVPTLTSTSTFVDIVFETAYDTVTSTTTITPTAKATSPAARECEVLSAANQGYFHGFKLACNNDNAAGIDLFGVPASTFSECLDICAGISECKGITFVGIVPGHPDHMCYGKAGTGLEENTNFDSAYIEEV